MVIGVAGGSLRGNSAQAWARNEQVARAGERGELFTGEVLRDIAERPGGPTVIHDLTIPLRGTAKGRGGAPNVDHVIVSGKRVYLLDSKCWQPGFYWTVGGRTRRGWADARHADSKTLPMAQRILAGVLAKQGVDAQFETPLIAVWSSRPGPLSLWAARADGARLISGPMLPRVLGKLQGADHHIVMQLSKFARGH